MCIVDVDWDKSYLVATPLTHWFNASKLGHLFIRPLWLFSHICNRELKFYLHPSLIFDCLQSQLVLGKCLGTAWTVQQFITGFIWCINTKIWFCVRLNICIQCCQVWLMPNSPSRKDLVRDSTPHNQKIHSSFLLFIHLDCFCVSCQV